MATRREENRQATRQAILAAARSAFGQRGYELASLADIVAAARVTTGAVYHHFGDKRGLFIAVAEEVEGEILQQVGVVAAAVEDPWARLLASLAAALDFSRDSQLRQIVFVDAGPVIGRAEWREMQHRFGYGVLVAMLGDLQARGLMRPFSVELLAPVLLAALMEAGSSIAQAADPEVMAGEAKATLSLFLESLRI